MIFNKQISYLFNGNMHLYVRIYIPIEYTFSYKEIPFKIMMGEARH